MADEEPEEAFDFQGREQEEKAAFDAAFKKAITSARQAKKAGMSSARSKEVLKDLDALNAKGHNTKLQKREDVDSCVRVCFTDTGEGYHTDLTQKQTNEKAEKGSAMVIKSWTFLCAFSTCQARNGRAVQQICGRVDGEPSGSTGGLCHHLKMWHPEKYQELAHQHPSHFNVKSENNEVDTFRVYDFIDAFSTHVKLVLWMCRDWRPFNTSSTSAFREFTSSLDKRYVPCSHQIYQRLIRIADRLLRAAIVTLLTSEFVADRARLLGRLRS